MRRSLTLARLTLTIVAECRMFLFELFQVSYYLLRVTFKQVKFTIK